VVSYILPIQKPVRLPKPDFWLKPEFSCSPICKVM
jgi:hypothetical protein